MDKDATVKTHPEKVDKTEKAFNLVSQYKREKRKCRIVLDLDGSGAVAGIEVTLKY